MTWALESRTDGLDGFGEDWLGYEEAGVGGGELEHFCFAQVDWKGHLHFLWKAATPPLTPSPLHCPQPAAPLRLPRTSHSHSSLLSHHPWQPGEGGVSRQERAESLGGTSGLRS